MKKIILWGVVSILIIGLAGAAFWWLRRPQVILLSGGTKLTLLGTDYGKHHKYPAVKTTGARTGGGSPGSFDTGSNTFVVWILSEHKANQWPNYEVLAYDKAATGCVGSQSSSSEQIKEGTEIMGIQLPAFPRRAGSIYLRIMNYGQNGQQVAKGQFVIANPARGPFPKWTPESLPDAQSDGDLDVTLTRLTYGVSGFNGGNGRTKDDPMSKAVLAAFRAEQKGVVQTNWQPVRIETSDATGNHVVNNSWSNSRKDDESVMTYQWGLWPDEPAWKLRVEFSKQSGFSDDEIWTITNVPVNVGSQQDMWNYGARNRRTNSAFATTTLNGIQLNIFPVVQFTNQSRGNGDKPGGFRVQSVQSLDGMQMTLVKATDDQGRTVQSYSGQGWGGNSRQLQFQNLRNAQTLNLTIVLHKSRFVEFTVKPEKAAAASP